MRLLHFDQTGRLFLTDFHGKNVPPYAILSHRWEGSEILFEDIASESYKEKKNGYRKLAFCAKQAAQDQLQYFWIDTCCIDRWNSRERSTAINSMFRWYSDATKCYVFLSDVSTPAATDTPTRSDWEASFRASEWFTRGWTLQELIAPASVEFFSCEETRLGDKTSLEQVLHEITDVPLAALRNLPLDQFSQRERMGWAHNRRTTEEEDTVYCLLGVVGVSMQVTYGEGKDKALRRLQMEVETANIIPSIIPFFRNDHFVGFETQLASLEAKLFSDKHTTTTLAIVGPGGTGKSQLALELAYRTKEKDKTCSVFWVDASSIDSLNQAYTSIAQRVGIPGWDHEKADTRQLVKYYLEQESDAHCLLFFDNTEDLSLGSTGADLTAYLPQSKRCSIVLTTTESRLAERISSHTPIELNELTPDAAKEMLQNYLKRPISSSEQQQAKHLLQELSHLPLAIVQAAAYINAKAITLQDYLSQLHTCNEHNVKQGSGQESDRRQGWDAESPVATTLLISLSEIRRSHALAADYLFLTACFAKKNIPIDLFYADDLRERDNAIQVLSGYALITRRPEDSALDVHGLVHHGLREWLQQQGQLSQQIKSALTQLYRVFPDDSHENTSKWRRLIPHTRYALSYRSPEVEGDVRLALAYKSAEALHSDGHYDEAEELFVQVVEIETRVLGEEHPNTLASMNGLVLNLMNQGRWKEAEDLDVQVIETRKRVLGKEHPNTLTSIGILASIQWNQGRWKEAEELEVQLMETRKRVLGEKHRDTLTSIGNLASTRGVQGRWKEAEELFVQVIEIETRLLGEEHPDTLADRGNLASTFRSQGRRKEAEELEVQLMETSKRVLGEEHPDTLRRIDSLGVVLSDQGRYEEAEAMNRQAVAGREKVLGREHPDTLLSMANLAWTLRGQDRQKEAEALEVQVLETRKRVLGEEHPGTLTSLNNLAETLRDQGKYDKAEVMIRQALAGREKVLGPEHPDTLESVHGLANLLGDQRIYTESLNLYKRACAGYNSVYGEDHPDTRQCREDYLHVKAIADAEEQHRVDTLQDPTTQESSTSATKISM